MRRENRSFCLYLLLFSLSIYSEWSVGASVVPKELGLKIPRWCQWFKAKIE